MSYRKTNRGLRAVFACLSAFVFVLQILIPNAASAQSASLDLGSSKVNTTAPNTSSPVYITVGGNAQLVNANQPLTQAERVAVFQVMKTGQQSIRLGADGSATGGSINLSNIPHPLQNLIIPTGVNALLNAAITPTFSLSGNLNNAGNLYAYSTNPANNLATISASNINNAASGLISTATGGLGAFGITHPISGLHLQLTAANNIVNAGRIFSAGNLGLTAGGSITNALPAGLTGALPTIQATNNLSMISGAGQITNAGLISSIAGNININTMVPANLMINNAGGRIEALAGSINIRDALFNQQFNTSLMGGDFVAQALNIHGGTGLVDLKVGSITGPLSIDAADAHVSVNSGSLQMGTLNVTGDPIFAVQGGDYTFGNGSQGFGSDLTVLASGNILAGTNTKTISTSGGQLNLIAGAAFTLSGTNYTVTGASSTGGNIDLSTSPSAALSTAGTGAAGNINLIAFANSSGNGGQINLGNAAINAKGAGAGGANGNVTIIAGATSGTGITIGGITANNPATGGTIDIETAAPSAGSGVTFDSTGVLTSGSFTPSSTLNSASISVQGSITGAGGNVTVQSGSDLLITGNVATTSPSTSNGANITLVDNSANTFAINGTATSGVKGTIATTAGGTSGNGGTISITNNGTGGIDYSANVGNIKVTANKGNGGTISLSAPNGTVLLPSGNLTLSAAGVTNGTGGNFVVNAANITANTANSLNVTANGLGTGSGGNAPGISITASNGISFGGNARLVLTANGGINGSGGVINVTSGGSSSDLTVGSSAGAISATATSGGNSGNGGSVSISAGRNLTVTPTSINVAPQGINGNGADISLNAGTSGSGALNVSSGLNVNGAGTGSAGNISLSYGDATNPFVVGNTVTNSGVAGSLQAIGSSGNGGNISISNNAAAPLNIALSGTISGNSTSGTPGTLSFNQPGQAVTVNGSGTLTGTVTANGSSVTIAPQTGNITTGSITATAGNVSVSSPVSVITMNGNVSATGDVTVSDPRSIVNLSAGNTVSGATATVSASTFNNNGTVSATGGDLNINAQSGSQVSVVMGTNSALTASGNVLFNGTTAAPISVTGGVGSITAGGNVNLNGGTGTVTVKVDSIGGTVLATGSNVNVTAASGGITFGALTATSSATLQSALDIWASGNISSSGSLTLTASRGVAVSPAVTLSGTSVSITTGTLWTSGTINATSGNLSIQGSGTGALTVRANGAAAFNANSAGSKILLNPTTAGAVDFDSGGLGSLSANGGVSFNGGTTGNVNIRVNNISGSIGGTGSGVNLYVTTGGITTSAITVSGGGTFTTWSNGGDLKIAGNTSVSGGTISLNGTNNILINSALSASHVYMNTTGASGAVTFAAGTTATNDLLVSANGSITVNSGVTLSSGGFTVLQAPALTMNGGSITTTGSIYIQSPAATGLSLGGTGGNITGSGAIVVNASSGGNLSMGGTYNFAGGSGGMLYLESTGTVRLLSSAVVKTTSGSWMVSAPSLNLSSGAQLTSASAGFFNGSSAFNSGTISASSNLVFSGSGSMSIIGSGTLSASSVEANSPGSSVTINQGSITGPLSGQAATTYTANVTGGTLNLGNLTANNGNLKVVLSSGTLNVNSNASLVAINGNVILENDGASGSTIAVNNAILYAQSPTAGQGQIEVTMGVAPTTPVAGTAPSNVTTNLLNGGQAFWGTNGITATGTNFVTVDASRIIFNTATLTNSAITINGSKFDAVTGYGGADSSTQVASSDTQSPEWVPVSYVQSLGAATAKAIKGDTLDGCSDERADIWFNESTALFTRSDKTYSLQRGDALFQSKAHLSIKCGEFQCEVPAHCIVLVSRGDSFSKLYNLSAATAAPVIVKHSNGHELKAIVGNEVVLVQGNSTQEVFHSDHLARRRTHELALPGGSSMASSEISPMSLLSHVRLLEQLRNSREHVDQKMIDSLLRTAACLQMTTAGHGPYSKQ